jgi:hypothetical protein
LDTNAFAAIVIGEEYTYTEEHTIIAPRPHRVAPAEVYGITIEVDDIPHSGSYISKKERVIMPTRFGICPILCEPEVLHRISLDCSHTMGGTALCAYLTRKLSSGPFPIRCSFCMADDLTRGRVTSDGIITQSPLSSLVTAGVITADMCQRILHQHIRLNPDQASLETSLLSSIISTNIRSSQFANI